MATLELDESYPRCRVVGCKRIHTTGTEEQGRARQALALLDCAHCPVPLVCRGVQLVQPSARCPLPTEAHTAPGELLRAGAAGHWKGLGRSADSRQLHAHARWFSPVYEKQLTAVQSRKGSNWALSPPFTSISLASLHHTSAILASALLCFSLSGEVVAKRSPVWLW